MEYYYEAVGCAVISLLTIGLVITLALMIRTRRQMHKQWLFPDDKPILPLHKVLAQPERTIMPQLPIKIAERVNKLIWVVFGVAFEVSDMPMLIKMLSIPGKWLIFLGTQSALILIWGFMSSIISAGRSRLLVLPDEIRLRRFGHTIRIRWQDVRLFALLTKEQIELSSTTRTIRISLLAKDSGYLPTIPYDEYINLRDGLLLTIVERTSLPLFDLRDRTPF